ncbi:hypothetical protein KQH29_00260 [bacterium]|nr:hypothetical protein [bacterium]
MLKSKFASQVAIQSGLVVLGTMLLYAILQYRWGEASLAELLLRHAWHSLAITILVFLFLQWRLTRLVYHPIESILEHGHEMANGVFRFKRYPTTGNELEDIMHTMNFMAAHLERAKATPWKHYAESIDTFLEMIQSREDLPIEIQAEIKMISDNLHNMEFSVAQHLPRIRPSKPAGVMGSAKDRDNPVESQGANSAVASVKTISTSEDLSWALDDLGKEAARRRNDHIKDREIPLHPTRKCG